MGLSLIIMPHEYHFSGFLEHTEGTTRIYYMMGNEKSTFKQPWKSDEGIL